MPISSPGIGSGLDVNSIVTKLVALEKRPLGLMQTKGNVLQSKLSAWGQIKSALATLDDAGTALATASTWNGRTFTSNNTSVTGSATATALASSFSLEVTNLAKTQSVKSGQLPTGSAIGSSGTLSIQVGQWTGVGAGTNFAGGAAPAVDISVASTDTLSDLASKINNAGAGVTALVVTNAGQDQLLIRGNATGDASGFRIQAADGGGVPITNGSGVGGFAFAHDGASFYGATRTQEALNANLKIDGIDVTSATNTVSNAVPGVTLNLTANTAAPVQITVGVDKEATKSKIEAFRVAYNSARTLINNLTNYDEGTKNGGPLLGDGTAMGVDSMLRNLAGSNGPSANVGGINRLSDMGLQMQRDGTLTTNTSKLDAAMNNLGALQTFLTNSSSAPTPGDGIARRIRDFARGANSSDGNVSGRSAALKKAISNNTKDMDAFSVRVARTETRLYAQFSRLDANVGTINSLGNFVSQQIAQWNKSG